MAKLKDILYDCHRLVVVSIEKFDKSIVETMIEDSQVYSERIPEFLEQILKELKD